MEETFCEVFTSKLARVCEKLTSCMGLYKHPEMVVGEYVTKLRAYIEIAYDIDILETYNEYIEFDAIVDMFEEEAYELIEERYKT